MISESEVASDAVTIQAPAELVWSILIDFERYSEWNRFCPQIKSTLEQFPVGIERDFNRCASDLKDYAENRYQQSCAQ